jgi:hypothetical protein
MQAFGVHPSGLGRGRVSSQTPGFSASHPVCEAIPLRLFNGHSREMSAEPEQRPIRLLNPCADADFGITTRTGDGAYNVDPHPRES